MLKKNKKTNAVSTISRILNKDIKKKNSNEKIPLKKKKQIKNLLTDFDRCENILPIIQPQSLTKKQTISHLNINPQNCVLQRYFPIFPSNLSAEVLTHV